MKKIINTNRSTSVISNITQPYTIVIRQIQLEIIVYCNNLLGPFSFLWQNTILAYPIFGLKGELCTLVCVSTTTMLGMVDQALPSHRGSWNAPLSLSRWIPQSFLCCLFFLYQGHCIQVYYIIHFYCMVSNGKFICASDCFLQALVQVCYLHTKSIAFLWVPTIV